jgi:hypothetical protein
LGKREREALVKTWHDETETQIEFVERVATEFELSPALKEQMTAVTSEWLTNAGVPLTFKTRKPSTAYNLFFDLASWVSLDQRITEQLKTGTEAKSAGMILVVLDIFSAEEDDDEIKEIRGQVKHAFFESFFDAAKAKLAKETIERKSWLRIKTDWKIQETF